MPAIVLPDQKTDSKAYHAALRAFIAGNPYLSVQQIREATGCTTQSVSAAQKAVRRQRAEAPRPRPSVQFDWAKFSVRSYGQSTEDLIRRTLARLSAGPKVVVRPVVRDDEEDDRE
jgi:hypothetical protein